MSASSACWTQRRFSAWSNTTELRSVDHRVGDLLPAVRGQAVHHPNPGRRERNQAVVHLEVREVLAAALLLEFLAHARPNVGVDDFGITQRRSRLVGDLEAGARRAETGRPLDDGLRVARSPRGQMILRCTPSRAAA